MSGSTDVLASGLMGTQRALTGRSGNLMDSRTVGGKGSEIQFLPGIGGTTAGGTAPSVRIHQAVSKHGAITATGNEKDFAIDGDGMLMVKKDGALYLTTVNSYRYEENTRTLTNGAGAALQVVELVNGKLPQNYSSVNNLVDASFRNISSSAESTKNIVIAANLDANGDLMDGPGAIIDYTIAGAASSANKAAIGTPGENSAGAKYIGDILSLTATIPGTTAAATASKFQYGGVSVSKKATASIPLYNASDATTRFNVSAQGVVSTGPTQLSFGQGIRITCGGTSYNFTATTNSNQEAQGQFTGLQSLCDSINSVTGGQVRATIGSDGRLYIAAKDADSGVSFVDINAPGGWPGMVDVLGLDNVALTDPIASGFTRYASDLELSQKINKVTTLSARFVGNTLRFGAASATSSLAVSGESNRTRFFQRATAGYQPAQGAVTDTILRNTISIQSSNHGLKVGDYVRIANAPALAAGIAAGALTNGIYRVDAITDDSFVIGTRAELTAYGGGATAAPPALGTSVLAALAPGANPTATWQKVEGGYAPDSAAAAVQANGRAGGGNNTAVSAVANGRVTVTLTLGAADPFDQLVVGDVVYIANSTVVNPGYYRLTGVGANIQFVATAAAGAGGVPAMDLTAAGLAAAGGNIADAAATVMKVTAAVAQAGGVEQYPIRLTGGSLDVEISVPAGNHTYNVGDAIVFSGLAAGGVLFNNISIVNGKYYQIKAVANNRITFTADGAAAGGGAGVLSYIGYMGTADAAGVNAAGVAAGAATTHLGPTACINYVSTQFKGMGINTSASYFSTPLAPTYGGGDPTKNFSSGTSKQPPSYTIETHVFDTFGIEHPVNISFGNMSEKVVAVEVWLPQNDQGVYDIDSKVAGTGLVAFGNIKFDGNGHIITGGVDPALQKLNFQWNNGAEPTTVQLDWGAVGGVSLIDGKPVKPGLTKLAGISHTKIKEPDGNAPGSVVGYKYSKSGVISAMFSNGLTKDVYQVLIGTVSNYDGLKHVGDGLYVAVPSESGQILMQIAGTAGAGSFISGALESSNVDASAEVLDSTGIANQAKMLYHQVSVQQSINDYALQQLH